MDYLCYNLAVPHAGMDRVSLLDERERQVFARRGNMYLLERNLLKHELARRTGRPPESIRLVLSPHGKPLLEGLHFNLSHSGDWLCLAFHDAPVGVDIQEIRRDVCMEALARRIMCAEQWEGFMSRGARAEEFYACWCAAEAFSKHAAGTIWQVRSYPFLYQEGRIKPLFGHAPVAELFSPAPGYCGAVAYTDQACQERP